MKPLNKIIAMVLFAATPASAAETVLWKEVSGWSVLLDKTMGNACYVTTGYEDGTVLRLGFDFQGPKGALYFGLGNVNWKALEPGKDYPVKIQFDNQPVWDATASGVRVGEMNFLHISTSQSNFADEFARKLSVRAYFNGRQIAALRLKGSSRAIDEMLECQKTVNELTTSVKPPQSKDPFEQQTPVKNNPDPFEL